MHSYLDVPGLQGLSYEKTPAFPKAFNSVVCKHSSLLCW